MRKLEKLFGVIILFAVVVLFYFINAVTPFVKDDIVYHFYQAQSGYDFNSEINSFSDAFYSQTIGYVVQNGRFLIHFITQCFCGFIGKETYNIFISLSFCGWIILFGKMCFPSRAIRYNVLPSIFVTFVFLLMSEEPSAFYTGVAFGMNYLFSSMMCMMFMYLYCYNHVEKLWGMILFCIIGFVAGLSQEMFACGTGAYLLMYNIEKRNTIKRNQWIAFVLFCIGALLLVLAPGNFNRIQNDPAAQNEIKWGILLHYLENYYLIIISVIIAIVFKYQKNQLKCFISCNIPVLSAFFLTFVFLSLTVGGQFVNGRLLMGLEFWGLIIFCRLFQSLDCPWINRFFKVVSPIASVSLVILLINILYWQNESGKVYKDFYSQANDKSNSELFYCFPDLHIPEYMYKYTYYRESWQHNEVWEKCYPKIYKKKILVYDQEALDCFLDTKKIQGDNPFYKGLNYIYTKEKLPNTVVITTTSGSYKKWDFITLLKRIVLCVKGDKSKISAETYPVEKLYVSHNKFVYRVKYKVDGGVRSFCKLDMTECSSR